MSARKPEVRLTREANRDIEDALLYTRRTWGESQRKTYQRAIMQAFRMLRVHPLAGHPRSDLFSNCRSVQVGQHVIYYHQARTDVISIVRVLHQRQDAAALVRDPGPLAADEP
jgi:toxin ParE1/3/4